MHENEMREKIERGKKITEAMDRKVLSLWFADWFKDKRKSQGLTQKNMSVMTGIPQSTISDWEQAKAPLPEPSRFVSIAYALGYTSVLSFIEDVLFKAQEDIPTENIHYFKLVNMQRQSEFESEQEIFLEEIQ